MAEADFGTYGAASGQRLSHYAEAGTAPDPYHSYHQTQAEISLDPTYGEAPEPHKLHQVTAYFGGLISLGLMIGVAVWGYQILVRDITGVPVVEALDGPMRVAPADPGGRAADHQGLSVNAVAEAGAEESPVEQVVLAPGTTDVEAGDAPAAGSVTPAPVSEAAPADAPRLPDGEIDVLALADQLAAAAEADRAAQADTAVEPVDDVAAAIEAAVATATLTAGLQRSQRPTLRPVSFEVPTPPSVAEAPRASAPAEVRAAPTLDVASADIAPGTRLVQLGAYDSADVARAEWDRLAVRFDDYLDGKQRLVQEATSGGRTFYRLRAVGFTDLADSRRFCSTLVAQGAACIPVEAR